MRNKKKQEEKEALEGKGRSKEDRAQDLPGGVTFVDRHREAAVSSEADIKKELRVSNHLIWGLIQLWKNPHESPHISPI